MRKLLAIGLLVVLAGCTAAPDDKLPEPSTSPGQSGPGGSDPAPGIAPQEGYEETSVENVSFVGTMTACGEGFCLNVTATNEGLEEYQVSNICVPPFSERMEQNEEPVTHREPMFYCQAFGLGAFGPGEMLNFESSWNVTLWNDENQAYEPAPQGAYQWLADFVFYTSGDEPERHTATLSFTVVNGAT